MYSLVTAPTNEPVTLEQIKLQCRVDGTHEDEYLRALGVAARKVAEARLRRALVTQTWRLTLDCFPAWEILIHKPPLLSVTSIAYVNTDGDSEAVDSSDYRVDIYSEPARIEPAYNGTWPTDVRDVSNAVTVTFTCGYGTDPDDVPETTRQFILMLTNHWYEQRAPVNIGNIVSEIPLTIEPLLAAESWGSYP